MQQVQELIEQGLLDEALVLIEKFNKLKSLHGKIYQARIFYLKGRFDKSHQFANSALEQAINEGRELEEISARIAIAYTLLGLNKIESSLQTLDRVEELLKNHTFLPDKYTIVKENEARMHNVRGLNLRYLGELDDALICYKKSQEIRAKLGHLYDFAGSLTNIGTIYRLKGELDEALKYHLQAKEIFKQFGNRQMLGYTLHDIAGTYWEQDNFELARANYDVSLSIRINLQHPINTAQTLIELIQLHIEFDYLDLSQYYLDILKEIQNDLEHPMIDIYYDLGTAILLQTSPRLLKRAEAQQIYQKLLDKNLPYEYDVMVRLNLCDLYLFDLKVSKDEEILKQVDTLISELFKIAKKQYSTSLLIETLLLKSKLALIRLDLDTAQSLLFQAEVYANQKNLHHLAYKVSAEHDMIVDKMYKWEKLKQRNASLIERLEEVNFDKTIDHLRVKRTTIDLNRELEKPLFLLILNQDDIPLFTKRFDDNVKINEELIGSYLLASDKGIATALNNKGSIERIKYGDYQLIFIHQSPLVFCYSFRGRSYFAIKRVNDFIDFIKLSRSWELLRAKVPKPKEIETSIKEKVNDYFTQDGIYSQQLKKS